MNIYVLHLHGLSLETHSVTVGEEEGRGRARFGWYCGSSHLFKLCNWVESQLGPTSHISATTILL